jgi:archaeosortase C (PEF-CTERM variant)
LLTLLKPSVPTKDSKEGEETPGIKLIVALVRLVGGDKVVTAMGLLVVLAVVVYNQTISARSEFGDLDTLSMIFGFMLMTYPFLVRKFKIEASFSLLFIALVVVFLVVPQAITSASSNGATSSIGNWYVHYMLAAPFAGVLNLAGIEASSSGNFVTLEFRDGSVQTLGISAYCAGLYSFSIFLAAFFSFVLVFERLPAKTLTLVLTLGLAIAYMGNLFRMVVIGVVGYYRGMDALLWTHENIGWIIFLSWSAVFWYILLGYVSKRSGHDAHKNKAD